MSTLPPNLEGFFLSMVILTTLFAMSSGIHIWYYLAGELGPTFQVDEKREDRRAPGAWALVIFLMDLVCLCAPVYLYINSGSGEFGDAEYRTAKIVYAVIIFTVCGILNFGYKAYFYAKLNDFREMKNIDTWERGTVKYTHQVLFSLHAILFWAVMVGCICAIWLPGGWRDDVPSNVIFVAALLIILNSLLSFVNRSTDVHRKGIELINHEKNFAEEESLWAVTPTAKILTSKAVKLDANKLKSELPDKDDMTMLGDTPINKNTVEGQLLIQASDHFGTPHVVMRKYEGDYFGLRAEDAVIVDNDFNQSVGGNMFKVGTVIPTAKRVIQRVSPYAEDGKPITDVLLDPVADETAVKNGTRNSYVALVRNLDLMKYGFFAFTEDVWSVAYGIGVHVNFTKDIVYPYVLFMNWMHVYFLFDTMYGNMAWCATTFVPLVIARRGTFSQFWDMHTKCFIVGWGLIALTRPAMLALNPSADTFIYDNNVWNNTLYYPGLCTTGCDDLTESVYLYVVSVLTIVVAIYYFFYSIMLTYVSWNVNTKLTLKKVR